MPLPRLAPRQHMERAAAVRLVQSHETALERNLAKAIAGLGRKAVGHFNNDVKVTALDFRTPLARVLGPSIRTTARAFGQQVLTKCQHLGLETKAFEDLEAGVEEFLRQYTAERVVQISDVLKRLITNIIHDGLENGSSVEQVAEAIVEATRGTMAMARARRIARTETHMAANAGQLAAARASPLDYRKEWLATEDKRTREDHAEANGQIVDLDEPFIVGGEEMMMPGDPNASAGQVINCRCTVMYHPIAGVERPEEGGEIELNELLADPDLWRAFFAQLQARNVLPSDVVLYATGNDCGLPTFASAEDLVGEIGQNIAPPQHASLNPIMVDSGAGLRDTFPLYGRPVVVKIAVPAGTRATAGAQIALEIALDESVTLVITAVTEEQWGEVQDEAGVPRDRPPTRYRHQRMPPRRGITLVEAEVQE
jgi:SPP1 gp7 family putative phage head morphogenesis protein